MSQLFDQNYDCVHCGKSCTVTVPVSATKVERLKESGLLLEIEQSQRRPPIKEVEGELQLARTRGKCIFLDRQRKCTIHSRLGAEAKPASCLSFPFLTVKTPDGISVGLDFTCTAVRENSGRPLSQQPENWQDLTPLAEVCGPLTLGGDCVLDWPSYRELASLLSAEFAAVGAVNGIARGLTSASRLLVAGQDISPELVAAAFDTTPQDLLAGDEIMQDTLAEMAFHLLVVLEAGDSEEALQLHQNLTMGFAVRLRRWDFRDEAYKVHRLASRQKMKVMDRYLQSLLARQLLATSPSVYTGLCTMAVLPVLFAWYAALSMLNRGCKDDQAQPEDEAFALERLERDFFGRFDLLEPYLTTFAAYMIDMIAPDGNMRVTGSASQAEACAEVT